MTLPERADERRKSGSSAPDRGLREALGVVMVLASALGLIFINNELSPQTERLSIHLGLALTCMISAGARGWGRVSTSRLASFDAHQRRPRAGR